MCITIGLACMAAGVLFAQSGGPGPSTAGSTSVKRVALSIPDETSPPGGIVQLKFMVTEPTPISTGKPISSYDDSTFDGVWGIELFNPTADVNGVAMIRANWVRMQYVTSSGTQGTDYPIMTMALHVRPDAVPGTQTQFSLDPSSTWTLGLLGTTTLKPMAPATIKVGGSISITNVVPGGGVLPVGSLVRILGMGFQPRSQVQLNAIKFSSIRIVSSSEIDFTLAQDTNMTGQKIQVVNPDGSQDTYFSYLRGIPMGQSDQPLLTGTLPIFSSMVHSMAVFSPVAPAYASQFMGVAMQNPNTSDVQVTVALHSSANSLMGSSTTTLPAGNRLMRAISELTQGAAPTFGSYVTVTASHPIQVFGFLGDNAAGTVTPFCAAVTQP